MKTTSKKRIIKENAQRKEKTVLLLRPQMLSKSNDLKKRKSLLTKK